MKRHLKIVPEEYQHINEEIIYELNYLFEAVSPADLRKSLHEILFRYLIQSYDIQRYDFQKIMEDIYMLTTFLQKAEKSEKGRY
jgi:hypothetical protein